jgi:hypothetical protein
VTRYTFLNLPCPDELAERIADRLVLRDELDGTHVRRLRTQHMRRVPDNGRRMAA